MATETTEQIVRESPEVEAYKLANMKAAAALQAPNLPQYQIAGLQNDQLAAIRAGEQGIGAYAPYLQAGQSALTGGTSTLGEAANILRGSDTRGQFAAAQQAFNNAAVPASQIGQLANVAGSGLGYLSAGSADMDTAQQMAMQSVNQPGFGQATTALNAAQQQAMGASPSDFAKSNALLSQGQTGSNLAATMAKNAATQPGFQTAQNALQSGIGSLSGAAQAYDPGSVQSFMNPYQQQVIDQAVKQINRQGAQSNEALRTQAIRAGAFGGGRDAVMQAEMQRNLAEAKDAAITNALASGYSSAQQQAQSAFEQQQQRQMAQGQNLAQTGAIGGSLASQQGQLGMQAAAQQFQAAGYDANTAMQMAQLQQTQQQQALAQSQAMQGIGSLYGQQAAQQAGINQNAASLYGNMGAQQAGLAGQYANIASQQAGILGQQSQLQQQLGQGIGNLANQQFGVGAQMAAGMGSLGSQIGNMGVQQAALGQSAQAMGQNDVNFLYNLGSIQQRQQQAVLDANRANSYQTAMQPYQQIAFQSDIYKGAPSTQMAITQQQSATPSAAQQVAGLGVAGVSTAGAAKTAGII